jgi:hypothetical protein
MRKSPDRFAERTGAHYCVLMTKDIGWMTLAAALALCPLAFLRADQVVMQNGDTYNGKVLSVTTNAVVLQNDNLGSVTLARSKITSISFENRTAKGSSQAASSTGIQIGQPVTAQTNASSDLTTALHGIGDQTNLIQQVQSQFLGSAGPDAVNKFNELLNGLSTGKIDLNGLQAEAQSAADQLRSLAKDLGPDTSGVMDSYLAILDNFLQEAAAANVPTNSSSAVSKARADSGPPQSIRSTNQSGLRSP